MPRKWPPCRKRRAADQHGSLRGSIVSLVKGKKNGLRSEEIRTALKLDKREMPLGAGGGSVEEAPRVAWTEAGDDLLRDLSRQSAERCALASEIRRVDHSVRHVENTAPASGKAATHWHAVLDAGAQSS